MHEMGQMLREYICPAHGKPSPCPEKAESDGAAMEPTDVTTVQVPAEPQGQPQPAAVAPVETKRSKMKVIQSGSKDKKKGPSQSTGEPQLEIITESLSYESLRNLQKDVVRRGHEAYTAWLLRVWDLMGTDVQLDGGEARNLGPLTQESATHGPSQYATFLTINAEDNQETVGSVASKLRSYESMISGPMQAHVSAVVKELKEEMREMREEMRRNSSHIAPVDQAVKIEVSKIDLDWEHKGELFLARWAHDASGHQGRDATYKWARDRGVDLTMDSISQIIHDCDTCAAIKQAKWVKPLWYGGQWSKYKYGEAWQIDYITLPQTRQGKRYVLTMVEATTGWLETYPVHYATAQNTILGLEKQILWRHGTPERIESDNGTHFRNSLINT
ncbi:hypothetical protein HGM15179_015064 [Zosterops borbonicus]|uniref:Integrase catalytic domain-containing protein n=1 Tax=Zosterops borbonicus TaxID=364589 RepID=A0A8K1LFL3_9PASS|nr:hypothetical protein HGM15179_015064 [Zosterops borbonicus]